MCIPSPFPPERTGFHGFTVFLVHWTSFFWVVVVPLCHWMLLYCLSAYFEHNNWHHWIPLMVLVGALLALAMATGWYLAVQLASIQLPFALLHSSASGIGNVWGHVQLVRICLTSRELSAQRWWRWSAWNLGWHSFLSTWHTGLSWRRWGTWCAVWLGWAIAAWRTATGLGGGHICCLIGPHGWRGARAALRCATGVSRTAIDRRSSIRHIVMILLFAALLSLALEWHRRLESSGQREALQEVVLVLVVCLIASMECILSQQQGCRWRWRLSLMEHLKQNLQQYLVLNYVVVLKWLRFLDYLLHFPLLFLKGPSFHSKLHSAVEISLKCEESQARGASDVTWFF